MACKYIYKGTTYTKEEFESFVKEEFVKKSSENKFLSLLEKDSNWVTFFIKSIISDSAKKGYEKVLFPTGNTASKVEGHSTLEEFKKQKEDRIKEIEQEKLKQKSLIGKEIPMPGQPDFLDETITLTEDLYKEYLQNANRELNQLKQELERVETEGFSALKPIYNFYENTVGNILKKTYKGSINEIKDEYGNGWYELSLNNKMLDSIDLLIAGSEQKFNPKEQDRINREKNKLYNLKQDLIKADKIKAKELTIDIQKQEVLINELEEQLQRFLNAKSLDYIYNQAELNLADVERILSQDNLSYEELNYVKDIISFWQAAGEFPYDEPHLFLDEDEANSPEIKERFIQYSNRADSFASKYLALAQGKIATDVSRMLNTTKTKEELFKAQKDAWGLNTNTLNLGRLDNDILNLIYTSIEKANTLAELEARERWQDIDEKWAKTGLKSFDIFKQVKANGLETGNLVDRFSQDYWDIKRELYSKSVRLSNKSKIAENPLEKESFKRASSKAWKGFYDWKKQNMLMLDVRMLFPDEVEEDSEVPEEFIYKRKTYADNIIEEHKNLIKAQLGEKGYKQFLEIQEKQINKFRKKREAVWLDIDSLEITEDQKKLKFEDWNKENSPYWALDLEESPAMRKKVDNSYYRVTYKSNVEVPYKIINGKDSGWYDKKFEQIESNENILEFYNTVRGLLKEAKSIFGDKADFMQMNSIPFIKNTIIDTFFSRGFTSVPYGIYNKFIESLRTDDIGNTQLKDVNPLTGEAKKEQIVRILTDRKKEIQDIVDLKTAQYRLDNNKNPDYATLKKFQEEAVDKLAKEKSFDLVRIMKAYSLAALSFKHRLAVEPFVRTAEETFKTISKAKTNKAGVIIKLPNGEIEKDGTLKNLQSALDYYINTSLYSYPIKKVEGTFGKKKIYTKEEKDKIKELENLKELIENQIDTAEPEIKEQLEKDLKKIDKQLEELGGKKALSRIGDQFLSYVSLKALGWNFLGSFTNMGFGLISNWIQAADGRLFTQKELRQAQIMTLSSVAKNLSFDQLKVGEAAKIRNLMDKLDILSDSSQELNKRGVQSTITNKVKTFAPYNLNQRAEYINQAPVMVAMMLHENLWDKFNDDGSLKEDLGLTNDDLVKFKMKVDKVIQSIHGDYKSNLKAKEIFIGRALLQFRSWAIEGFASRFESSKYDSILEIRRKGRYRTGFGIISYAEGTGMSTPKQILFNLKQLGRKIILKKTQYNEAGFSPEDAANMRKNLNELLILISLFTLILILKAGIDDEDEEREFNKIALNLLINTGTRLQTDITFYSSPKSFESLNKNILPLFQVVNDASKFVNSIQRQIQVEEDSFGDKYLGLGGEPTLQSGSFKGTNELLKTTGELIPISNQFLKFYKSSDYIFGKNR